MPALRRRASLRPAVLPRVRLRAADARRHPPAAAPAVAPPASAGTPGDWVWLALPTLLVAVLGAAAAIAITEHRSSSQRSRLHGADRAGDGGRADGRAGDDDRRDRATRRRSRPRPSRRRAPRRAARGTVGSTGPRPRTAGRSSSSLTRRRPAAPPPSRRPRRARRQGCARSGSSTPAATRACSRATSSSSAASTPRRPMPMRASARPAGPASEAPTPARSPADRHRAGCVALVRTGKLLVPGANPFTRLKTFVTAPETM